MYQLTVDHPLSSLERATATRTSRTTNRARSVERMGPVRRGLIIAALAVASLVLGVVFFLSPLAAAFGMALWVAPVPVFVIGLAAAGVWRLVRRDPSDPSPHDEQDRVDWQREAPRLAV